MKVDPSRVRTWSFGFPTAEDSSAPHSATLLINDEPIASATGMDSLSATRNLMDLQQGIETRVVAWEAFEHFKKETV